MIDIEHFSPELPAGILRLAALCQKQPAPETQTIKAPEPAVEKPEKSADLEPELKKAPAKATAKPAAGEKAKLENKPQQQKSPNQDCGAIQPAAPSRPAAESPKPASIPVREIPVQITAAPKKSASQTASLKRFSLEHELSEPCRAALPAGQSLRLYWENCGGALKPAMRSVARKVKILLGNRDRRGEFGVSVLKDFCSKVRDSGGLSDPFKPADLNALFSLMALEARNSNWDSWFREKINKELTILAGLLGEGASDGDIIRDTLEFFSSALDYWEKERLAGGYRLPNNNSSLEQIGRLLAHTIGAAKG